jgi:hypothetical protein
MASAARTVLLGLALAASAGGVALQYALLIAMFGATGAGLIAATARLFLYFTILANILVAAACVAALRDPAGRGVLSGPQAQGGIALAIAVVGIVYGAILAALWTPTGWQYVADLLVHRLAPLLFFAAWLVAPKGGLVWRDAVLWLVFPAVYLVYALIRGGAEGFYPYPFLDVAALGAAAVAVNALLMLALFVGLGLAMVALDRAFGARGV